MKRLLAVGLLVLTLGTASPALAVPANQPRGDISNEQMSYAECLRYAIQHLGMTRKEAQDYCRGIKV